MAAASNPNTYKAFLGNDPILHPDAPKAHHIRHHYVGKKPIPHNSDLARRIDVRIRCFVAEVVHDFRATAGLFRAVSQDLDASGCLQETGFFPFNVIACAGGVADNQKA